MKIDDNWGFYDIFNLIPKAALHQLYTFVKAAVMAASVVLVSFR